jgi:H+/Cl- antiporter ClcA
MPSCCSSEPERPAVGGLLLGGLLLALPQMYGVGYTVLGKTVAGGYVLAFLLVLLIGKVLATSLTIGIGGSGGVFAPSLFIGAMLGETFGVLLHGVAPQLAPTPGAYALVGMGAVFAGAACTPITAVIIMFELTDEYHIILPLMLAIALSAGISKLLRHRPARARPGAGPAHRRRGGPPAAGTARTGRGPRRDGPPVRRRAGHRSTCHRRAPRAARRGSGF